MRSTTSHHGKFQRQVTIALLLIGSIFVPVSFLLPPVPAHSGDVLAAFGTPTVDGIISPGEYASCITRNVATSVPTTITFCEENDYKNDYYALQINDSLTATSPNDFAYILFDNKHNGQLCPPDPLAEDAIGFVQGVFKDMNYCGGPVQGLPPPFSPANQVPLSIDSIQNGVGVLTFAPGVGYTYEMSHPLNSGDPLDYALTIGDTVGWCLNWYDSSYSPSPSAWYPNDCFPAYFSATPVYNYGDVVKVGIGATTTTPTTYTTPYTYTTITTWDTEIQTMSVTSTLNYEVMYTTTITLTNGEVTTRTETSTGYITETTTMTTIVPITTYTLSQSYASTTVTCIPGTTQCKTITTTIITEVTNTEAYQSITTQTTTQPTVQTNTFTDTATSPTTTTATLIGSSASTTTDTSVVSSHLTTTTSTVPEFPTSTLLLLISLAAVLAMLSYSRRRR